MGVPTVLLVASDLIKPGPVLVPVTERVPPTVAAPAIATVPDALIAAAVVVPVTAKVPGRAPLDAPNIVITVHDDAVVPVIRTQIISALFPG